MKRMALLAATTAALALVFAPGASAYLSPLPFNMVSASSATFGPHANTLTLSAIVDSANPSAMPVGTLRMSATDTRGEHTVDASVDCLSVDVTEAGVLAHVTNATGEPAGLAGVFLRLTDTEPTPAQTGAGDKVAVTTFNQRQYDRQLAAGCAHAPGKASLLAGNVEIALGNGAVFNPCIPTCLPIPVD